MRKTLLVVLLLAAVAAVAATPDSSSQAVTTTPVVRHYLTAGARPKMGFCRCSCGFQCSTSADCGGVSCDPFITCCARKSQNPEIDWFTRSFESSSHQTSLPDAILKEVLKAECK
jgi:hypothetical protein